MGNLFSSWFSSNEEKKQIENDGQINNEVVIQDVVEIYNLEIVVLLLIIVALKIVEFIYFVYRIHVQKIKKRYQNRNVTLSHPNVSSV